MTDTARTIRVVIDSSGAKSGAQQVNQALSSIGKSAGSTSNDLTRLKTANDNAASSANRHRAANDNLGKSVGNLRSLFGQASGQLGALGGAAEGAASRMGTFASVGRGLAALGVAGVLTAIAVGLGAVGIAALDATAKVQQFKANLLTITGSTAAAESAYRGLVEFANKTPFSLDQSIEGFTKLRSLGLSTSEAIMTSYGNTSAAMGKDMSQMIEAVADATTGEFERLKEFGIKASKSGDEVAFTFQGVTTKVKNNAAEIEKYLVGIGQTQFAGAMENQMNTLNGAFASFEDNLFSMMAALGDGPFGAAVADMINTIADGIGSITPLLSGVMDVFGGIVSAVWDVLKGLTSMFTYGETGASGLKSSMDNLAVVFAYIGEAITVFGQIANAVFSAVGNVAGMVVGGIQDAFGSMLNWLIPTTQAGGQSMGESFVGVLRAASYVAGQLPNIFKVALLELKTMFSQAGYAMAETFKGNFSEWKNVNLSFGNTQKVVGRVLQNAGKIQQDQKGNRAWIDQRKGVGVGNIDYSAAGGGATAGKKSGDDKAAKEAERRAKAQKEFWDGMEKELELSKLTTSEAEKRRKAMEYEKIVGRDITADEKKRLTSLMEQTKANEYLQKAGEDHRNKMIELTSQQEILEARLNGATNEQLEIKKAIEERIVDLKKQGITLSDTQLDNLKKQVEEEAKKSAEIAKQNKMLDRASELAKEYSKSRQKAEIDNTRNSDLAAAQYALDNGRISKKDFEQITKGINQAANEAITENKFKSINEFGAAIDQLADDFGGDLGKVLGNFADGLNQLVGSLQGQSGIGLAMKKMGLGDVFGDTMKDWFSKDSDLGKMFSGLKGSFNKLFGNNGTLVKGLGKTLGAAGAGAQIGQTTAVFGKMISSKFSTTGSTVGGAIGGAALGPIGAIAGSIIGGTIGGLLKKAKYGTASIAMGSDGELSVGSVNGNKSSYKENASTAAGSVISGIESIAEALGGTISGTPNISIGQYKGKWRVSNTGRTGKLKGKYGDVTDFGKDGAEDAVAYAVSEALKQGILTGVSEFTKRVLKTMDTDEAVTLAQSYESILDSLASYKNPIKGAVDEVASSIDTLAEQMKKAGATSEELANVEEYRSIKLQEVLKNQVSGFQDLLDDLNGDMSGKSTLALLNEDMSKMNELRKTLASGGAVDQDIFTTLGQSIMGRAQELYGSQTSAYQSIRNDLIALSEQALGNAEDAFNVAAGTGDTYTAINDQTEQVTASISTTNDLLGQLLTAFTNGNGSTASALKAVNGSLINYN